jgi:two-component system, response regulator YesN
LYKLIIVDDESEIRNGLLEIIDWEKEGFVVVGEAENGLDALQMAESMPIDLVITDIRMPFLDGLQMAKEIRKLQPMVSFIVLSGYDDFEYTRQAIQIKISDYVLKPVSSDELIPILRSVKNSMDERFAQHRDVRLLQERFSASLPILRDTLLTALMQGRIDPKEALQSAAQYDLDLCSSGYIVASMRICSTKNSDSELAARPDLLRIAVINILNEMLQEQVNCRIFQYDSFISALFMVDDFDEKRYGEIIGLLDTARLTVARYLDCPLAIGISKLCNHLDTLSQAASQAQSAMDFSTLFGDHTVLTITDVEMEKAGQKAIGKPDARPLINAIKIGDIADTKRQIRNLLHTTCLVMATISEYQVSLSEVYMAIVNTANEMGFNWVACTGGKLWSLEAVLLCKEVGETEAILSAMCKQLVEGIASNHVENGKRISQEAIAYLKEHFAEQSMNLERICGHLHISTAYFSTVFKKETKKTFHKYLTELRMDRAMTLLLKNDLKTAQIAEMVGMGEASYFSYSFKKHFGVSPSMARKNITGDAI